jgi:hypothetical protein
MYPRKLTFIYIEKLIYGKQVAEVLFSVSTNRFYDHLYCMSRFLTFLPRQHSADMERPTLEYNPGGGSCLQGTRPGGCLRLNLP